MDDYTTRLLPSSYEPGLVLASFLVAALASYVALDLAQRVRRQDGSVAAAWWAGGSIAMGSGIWCMHFVGMLAFSLPIDLGYTVGLTFVSWIAAIAASAVALNVASRPAMSWRPLAGGAAGDGRGHLRHALHRHVGARHGAGHRLGPVAGRRLGGDRRGSARRPRCSSSPGCARRPRGTAG